MTFEVRRVVTGHDEKGKAIVVKDEIATNVRNLRPGAQSTVVWASDTMPPDLRSDSDISHDIKSTIFENGTVCRIAEFGPGIERRVHRTASLDYAIILEGEIDMELDDEVVHLKAGDVVIQRGTVHCWVNNGTEPCKLAFILIHADMPEFGGKALEAFG
ncbi:MAG TPA: cupin domain-containing protein [Rhodospirillaceae bacterium]|mgnify:CR=1 FL=1|nr:cupin domain-containing protein [Rhodospirillaceae bacterium]HAT35784.1 cupin domain-containing protein [Rhodospirillaceae bacterium]